MRVLIIPRPEPSDAVTSGIGRYVGILERHLGAEIEVVHLPGAPHEEDRQFLRPVETGGRRGWGTFVPSSIRLALGYLRDTVSLAKQLRPYRNQVDLIHVNRVGCEIQTIAARLAGFRRIVATIHNLPGEDQASGHWVRRLVERLSFACAGHLIAVSLATYEAWHDRIGLRQGKVTVVYNGLDWSDLAAVSREEERRKFAIPESTVVFGICARLHPMKGHAVLLEAFARLLREPAVVGCQVVQLLSDNPVFPSASSSTTQQLNNLTTSFLLIAGDGPEEERIRARIKDLGLQERVQMMGRVQDVPGFMATLDVHLLPSVMLESMPFSVIEAMFAGVPSVVSDVGGAKEIVREADAGLVIPKGDVKALAEAMDKCLKDPEYCSAAGLRGQVYARSRLTGAMMTRATEQVYRRIMGEVD